MTLDEDVRRLFRAIAGNPMSLREAMQRVLMVMAVRTLVFPLVFIASAFGFPFYAFGILLYPDLFWAAWVVPSSAGFLLAFTVLSVTLVLPAYLYSEIIRRRNTWVMPEHTYYPDSVEDKQL